MRVNYIYPKTFGFFKGEVENMIKYYKKHGMQKHKLPPYKSYVHVNLTCSIYMGHSLSVTK